jgi:hypothetical protein
MVRSSFLASQFAASVTSSRSKELTLVLMESAPVECPVLVGRDFKLQRVSTRLSKLKHKTLHYHNSRKQKANKETKCYLSKSKGLSSFLSDDLVKTSAFGIDFFTA